MNREEWYKNPENLSKLTELIESTVFQNAVTILKQENEPKITTETELNVTLAVSRHNQAAGFFRAFRELKALTEQPKPKTTVKPKSLIKQVIETPLDQH